MNIAIIGLDSSHTCEYVNRMQNDAFDPAQRTYKMRAASCMAFPTAFQNEEGITARAEFLRSMGVNVVSDFAEAVTGADAIMIEVNDPELHLKYMTQAITTKLPLFLDKPMAGNYADAVKIAELVKNNGTRFFTSSPLRFSSYVIAAAQAVPKPTSVVIWSPIVSPPAGSDIFWYGVHAFEMLQRVMGLGATHVRTLPDENGMLCCVSYANGRRGIIEFTRNHFQYGGILRDQLGNEHMFKVNAPHAEFYGETLRAVESFFDGGNTPVDIEASLEITAMMDAAERSRRGNSTHEEV